MIYFVKANNRIKIGYAKSPDERIAELQTSCPYPIEVLLIMYGNRDAEYKLHRQFEGLRATGEWFKYEEPLIKHIKECSDYDRKYEYGFDNREEFSNEQMERIRKKHNLKLNALGRKLGITSVSVKQMIARELTGSITIRSMRRFAVEMGYKFEYRFIKK